MISARQGVGLLVWLASCHWVFPYSGGDASSTTDRRLGDGPLTVGSVEAVAELNSAFWETDPVLTGDGLTIYFASTRNAGAGTDIFKATRPVPDGDFATLAPVLGINSPGDEFFAMTPDNRLAVLTTNRPDTAVPDLWLGKRDNTTDWAFVQFARISELSTPYVEYDARLSQNGLRLYYAPEGLLAADQQLVVAERPELEQAFGKPTSLLGAHAGPVDADPALSADETLLVFTSVRDGQKTTDLYYAVRPSRDRPFSAPLPLSGINTSAYEERDPFITADGQWIYFTSTRTPTGQQDIFRAPLAIHR